jgi:hypothetical protein
MRELAEQAGLRFTQLMSNPMVPVVDGKETDLEKFAELIVQECLKIAKNREDEFESAGLLSESNAVGNVAYRISRQFGVKE